MNVSKKTGFDLETQVLLAREKFERERRRNEGKDVPLMKRKLKEDGKRKTKKGNIQVQQKKDNGEATVEDRLRLERLKQKAEIYRQIKRGKIESDVLRNKQNDDSDQDSDSSRGFNSEDSGAEFDNELIEVMDEFGRVRKVKRSQAFKYEFNSYERYKESNHHDRQDEEESITVSRPDKILRGNLIQHQAVETSLPIPNQQQLNTATNHYDSNWELRDKGVGFYKLSQDEERRAQQLKNIKQLSETTKRQLDEKAKIENRRTQRIARRRQELQQLLLQS